MRFLEGKEARTSICSCGISTRRTLAIKGVYIPLCDNCLNGLAFVVLKELGYQVQEED